MPGAAERCARALPEGRMACLLVEGVGSGGAVREPGASQSARWLRAIRTLRHGLWRVKGRAAGLLDGSSADVGFSAGRLGADAALPGL